MRSVNMNVFVCYFGYIINISAKRNNVSNLALIIYYTQHMASPRNPHKEDREEM